MAECSNCGSYPGCLRSVVNPAQLTTTSSVNLQEPDTVTAAVVTAVADTEGTSPMELEPLATVIDPDSLTEIVRDSKDVTLEFTYHGYYVHVSTDSQVTVRE